MAIVTFEYYKDTYLGEPIAESDFPRAEAKAERLVNQITHGRAANFAALPAFQQSAVKEAICAQVEYYALMGTDVSVNGDTGGNGWSIGAMRINGGAASGNATGAGTMIGAATIAALEQTGLLNPQVPTLGEPPRVPYPWGYC